MTKESVDVIPCRCSAYKSSILLGVEYNMATREGRKRRRSNEIQARSPCQLNEGISNNEEPERKRMVGNRT